MCVYVYIYIYHEYAYMYVYGSLSLSLCPSLSLALLLFVSRSLFPSLALSGREIEWLYAYFELAQRDPFRGKVCIIYKLYIFIYKYIYVAHYHSLSVSLSLACSLALSLSRSIPLCLSVGREVRELEWQYRGTSPIRKRPSP